MSRSPSHVNTLPLSALEKGQDAEVVELSGSPHFQSRVSAMGIRPGSLVQVLRWSGSRRGPVLVGCKSMRIAIGRGMADRIVVRPKPSG